MKHFTLLPSCLLLVLFSSHAPAQFVELTAEIETFSWRSKDSAGEPSAYRRPSAVWPTRCIVGTNTWLIEVTFESAKEAWYYTGTNLIVRKLITGYPSRDPELFKRNHPEQIGSIGRQTTNIIESLDGNIAGMADRGAAFAAIYAKIPWLAFCSGSFLKLAGRRVPLAAEDWSGKLTWSDRTKNFEDELGLPSAVDLLTTNGQPVLQYRVAGTTNLLGWEFPLEFHLVQYRPAETNVWQLQMIARGKVSKICVTTNLVVPGPPLEK